jgi:hypothetical protein
MTFTQTSSFVSEGFPRNFTKLLNDCRTNALENSTVPQNFKPEVSEQGSLIRRSSCKNHRNRPWLESYQVDQRNVLQ